MMCIRAKTAHSNPLRLAPGTEWTARKAAHGAVRYQENRDAILEKGAKESTEFREWLQILRANNGCEDCGTHEGRLLHHHLDPNTKRIDVSQMYTHSLDALEEELEKCVVLCSSRHKRRHAAMRDKVALG